MRYIRREKAMPSSLAGTMLLSLAMGCSESNPAGPAPVGTSMEVEEFLTALPSWSSFTADVYEPDQPAAPTGAPPTGLPDEVVELREYDDEGEVIVHPEVTYQCRSTPYSITSNPREIVMYDPDASILWPGGLIQGKSRKELGSLLGLPVSERTPVRIFIDDFATADNFRVVENPNAASVSSAKGEIVGNATASGLSAPSSIDFVMRTHHSEEYMALSASLSGRYLGYSAKVGGSFQRNAAQTTVTAHFIQRMFTLAVTEPQTPGAFFSGDFTQAKLDEQVRLGRMGPDNVPIYVSEVVYGRMMTFSLTSTASETDIRATLQAAYDGIGVDVELTLNAKQRAILRESEIKITTYGGDGQATLDMIRTGNWAAYFTDAPPLSTAEPLSFTFRNLGDGSIAGVTESTTYDIKQCDAVPASPGTFTFLDPQVEPAPFTGGVQTLTGDIDGDGRTDMIWNQLQQGTNQLFVGLSAGDGTFAFTSPFTHPESAPEGWGNYTVTVADLNHDPYADLVWNHLGNENKSYLGLGNGDGTFGTPAVRIHSAPGWGAYRLSVGDAMGPAGSSDGRDDLVWTHFGTGAGLGIYSARSDAGSLLTYQPYQNLTATSFAGGYVLFPANLDGDGDMDLVLNYRATTNRAYVVKSDGDGTWTLDPGYTDNPTHSGWSGFALRTAAVSANGADALIWADTVSAASYVSVGRWTGSDFTYSTLQQATLDKGSLGTTPLDIEVADVDGDGDADIVWNLRQAAVNNVYVSLGRGDGTFDFSTVKVPHPDQSTNWSQYQMFTGDVNGDGRDDIVWSWPAATNRVYTAIGKH